MNPVSWIEIPVADISRAVEFYSKVFQWDMQVMDLGELQMAVFPMDPDIPGAGGALVQNPNYTPSNLDGALVYFHCDDVARTLELVNTAGGNVLREQTLISPEMGYMGLAIDTEGNRIALHAKISKS